MADPNEGTIYEVTVTDPLEPAPNKSVLTYLVRAKTRAVARNFVAGKFITVKVPTPTRLVRLVQDGVNVEDA